MTEYHYTQAGWTCEEEGKENALHLTFHGSHHSKTLPFNSSLNQAKILNRIEMNEKLTSSTMINGRRQSKRKELLGALRNFTKDQTQSQSSASSSSSSYPHQQPNSAPANITGFQHQQITRPSTSYSSSFDHTSTEIMQRVHSVGNVKTLMDENEVLPTKIKTRQRPRTGIQSKSNAINNHENKQNQSSSNNTHSRTKSLFIQSTNFLRGSSSEKQQLRLPDLSIASDYSDPTSTLPKPLPIITQPMDKSNKNLSQGPDIRMALTYPMKNKEMNTSNTNLNQSLSTYIPTSARRKSFRITPDENLTGSTPFPSTYDVRQTESNFPIEMDKRYLLPNGWTTEQERERKSGEGIDPLRNFYGLHDGMEDDLIERLANDILVPSNMASSPTKSSPNSSRRSLTAAKRYASLYKNNQSEENLSSSLPPSKQQLSIITPNEFRRKSTTENFVQKEFVLQEGDSSQKPEKITPLPPRRMVRRARVQSTCEIESRQGLEKEFLNEKRPSMPTRKTTYPNPTGKVERIRVQRRTSESCLSSAAASARVLTKKSSCSSDKTQEERRQSHSIGRNLKGFRSEESLVSSIRKHTMDDGKQSQDLSRFSFSSSSSFQSNTTEGTNGTSVDDESDCSESMMAKGPIIIQPFPSNSHHQENALGLSPTSFASANSEIWGSCYSNVSLDKANHDPYRRPRSAESDTNIPPVPSVPAKYAINRSQRIVSESNAMIEKHLGQIDQNKTRDDILLRSLMMKRTHTTPTMSVQYGSDEHEEDEGSICLETPTFGYVASFVTATNLTPRPNNLASFGPIYPSHVHSFPHHKISPRLTQDSLNGPLNSHFTLPQFRRPSSSQGGFATKIKMNDVFDPRSMKYVEPISPKTKFEGGDEESEGEKTDKNDSITKWQKSVEPLKNTNENFPTSFGLGLSHVKLALAEKTYTLSKINQENQQKLSISTANHQIRKVPSRTFAQRSSVSQGGSAAVAAIQNRRNSLRLGPMKSRG